MAAQEPKDVVIYLKSGDSISGKLTSIDKVKLKITLIQATKMSKDDPNAKETFDTLEVNKDEIGEIKLVKYENPKPQMKEEVTNVNAIPENKIPQKMEQQKEKTYDKNESFFDKLTIASKGNQQETKNYNDKNKDTFNLPNEPDKKFNYQHKRGGYNNYNNRGYPQNGGHRGRGGKGRGGNYNNYNNGNNFQKGNFRGGKPWGNRGRGRGGHFNRGGGNFGNKPNNHPNVDTSKLKPYQPEGGVQPEMEKSIYDN